MVNYNSFSLANTHQKLQGELAIRCTPNLVFLKP
jgi:hypothetical protein